MDCVLNRMVEDNTQAIAKIEQKQQSLLADEDSQEVQQERHKQLALCKRRARILHVMLQLLLCNGAPTSGFSIKAMQFARARVEQLRRELPPMEWHVCLPYTRAMEQ